MLENISLLNELQDCARIQGYHRDNCKINGHFDGLINMLAAGLLLNDIERATSRCIVPHQIEPNSEPYSSLKFAAKTITATWT